MCPLPPPSASVSELCHLLAPSRWHPKPAPRRQGSTPKWCAGKRAELHALGVGVGGLLAVSGVKVVSDSRSSQSLWSATGEEGKEGRGSCRSVPSTPCCLAWLEPKLGAFFSLVGFWHVDHLVKSWDYCLSKRNFCSASDLGPRGRSAYTL